MNYDAQFLVKRRFTSSKTSLSLGGSPSCLRNKVSRAAMYVSPNEVVIAAAVVPEIAPPATEPTPGNNFRRPPTIARPVMTAAVPPTVLAVRALRKLVENDNP
jgi:hypothetical protein